MRAKHLIAMVTIEIDYEGELHCRAVHGPSGTELATDAPVDNQGRGESFSPTDLVATALGSCIMTTMGIVAARHEVSLSGMKTQVGKEMTTEGPRKIARLTVDAVVPLAADHPQREVLERAAATCPVHRSLSAEVEVVVNWKWVGEA